MQPPLGFPESRLKILQIFLVSITKLKDSRRNIIRDVKKKFVRLAMNTHRAPCVNLRTVYLFIAPCLPS